MKNLLFVFTGLCLYGLIALVLLPNYAPADAEEPPAEPPKYQKHTIEEILDNSDDEELVKISGELVKKIKCSTYLFRGETGDIQIHIDTDAIPERGLPFKEPMMVKGTVNIEEDKPVQVEVDNIRFVF